MTNKEEMFVLEGPSGQGAPTQSFPTVVSGPSVLTAAVREVLGLYDKTYESMPQRVLDYLESEEFNEAVENYLRLSNRYQELSENIAELNARIDELTEEKEELHPLEDAVEIAHIDTAIQNLQDRLTSELNNRHIFKTHVDMVVPEWVRKLAKAAVAYRRLAEVAVDRLNNLEVAIMAFNDALEDNDIPERVPGTGEEE